MAGLTGTGKLSNNDAMRLSDVPFDSILQGTLSPEQTARILAANAAQSNVDTMIGNEQPWQVQESGSLPGRSGDAAYVLETHVASEGRDLSFVAYIGQPVGRIIIEIDSFHEQGGDAGQDLFDQRRWEATPGEPFVLAWEEAFLLYRQWAGDRP